MPAADRCAHKLGAMPYILSKASHKVAPKRALSRVGAAGFQLDLLRVKQFKYVRLTSASLEFAGQGAERCT